MAVKRRGGAFALVLALLMGAGASACTSHSAVPIPPHQQNFDAAVYQECDSVCIRPGDCAKTFNDDGICPPGFLCALHFTCTD
jgi:hypothetical protein